ncbi:MAG TPA: molecular chaperone TorD family protein [Gammaproteobacteria bacterium]|nr:molecular chaperone TorD family protein [Gammaproteobacteria bacterium]
MPGTDNQSIEDEQRYRASAYALLAGLLRAAPDQALLDYVSGLSPDGNDPGDDQADDLGLAMSSLAAAARGRDPTLLEEEYNSLFIGVGKGEVVPYGSWYMTGFLMEQPLSDLRDDLRTLGFERSENTHEPEDHAAALFEVFSVIISEASGLPQQQVFFKTHMQPWLERFFADLGEARSADFYRNVAQFGAAFLKLEFAYLTMHS